MVRTVNCISGVHRHPCARVPARETARSPAGIRLPGIYLVSVKKKKRINVGYVRIARYALWGRSALCFDCRVVEVVSKMCRCVTSVRGQPVRISSMVLLVAYAF
jgi:hypothetical protein